MAERTREGKRSHVGYGSTYSRGRRGAGEGIDSVLGGQAWTVKPDRDAATQHPCIWMQAGVVGFKNCNNFYDCTRCKYDRGMQTQVAKGKQISWQEAMRRHPDLQRLCRHSLTGRIASRACAYDYQCGHCDFDQYFEEVWSTNATSLSCEKGQVRGITVPYGHYFHVGHAWARIESGGEIRVGLDDFASRLFGKADAMALPLLGFQMDPDRPGFGFKRGGNEAQVLSPLGGVVTSVNARVLENPDLSAQAPYDEGWLFMLHTPDVKKAVNNLMDSTESMDWIGREVDRLEQMIEDVAGPLATDGGLLAGDIYGAMPALDWSRLARTFLKA
jgi:glycine cleavage system H lipoate-binding protein